MIEFQLHQNTTPGRSGVRLNDVYELLSLANGPMSVKELGMGLGVDMTVEENIKDVSNRCGYLLSKGLVERVSLGVYRALNKQEREEMTETMAALPKQDTTCSECGFEAKSPMGLKAHMTRAHAPKDKLNPDQAFERIGEACEVLFPNGIPMSRIIEIADLQKAMLRVLTR